MTPTQQICLYLQFLSLMLTAFFDFQSTLHKEKKVYTILFLVSAAAGFVCTILLGMSFVEKW